MNFSLDWNLSIYNLAVGEQTDTPPLLLSSATLLSLMRAQIDLLIEQQITATLLVKFPPGKIWHSELDRYQASTDVSTVIYKYKISELKSDNYPSRFSYINLNILSNSQFKREYFFIVLSPQFCSLILAYRPLIKSKNTHTTPLLLAINTVQGETIQAVLNGINNLDNLEALPVTVMDFICPISPTMTLINQLLVKQLQRQDEINRQIMNKRIGKLQQQNQNLLQKEQLKDEYLINVCQELRTPLTHTKTTLSLLNSPHLKPPQRQRYLQMLNNQCDRQNSLITGLLDLLNLEHDLDETKLELVRLSDIVPVVVSTYQPLAQEKGIMLGYTIPTDLPLVWCVVGGLRQIVINLLHNSIKFTPNGGQVLVRSRVQGNIVQLEFRDTGIGIAENEIPKIFDRFYRVRTGIPEETSGAGLGLTIVEKLLNYSGGSISVKSKLDEGSIFTINLTTAKKFTIPESGVRRKK